MTITIELPDALETELAEEAARRNLSLSDYVVQVLRSLDGSRPKTGAEVVAYWQSEGLLTPAADSYDAPAHARTLREHAQHRWQDSE